MTIRPIVRNVAFFTIFALGSTAPRAQAGFMGSLALEAFGASLDTPGLADATIYTLPTLLTAETGTEGFASVPGMTDFTATSFALGTATGLTISNATYGTFTETAAPQLGETTIIDGVVVARSFYILGDYSGGPVGSATPASFTVSFTQDGGPGSALSASGSLTIPPASVPEPGSVVMLGLGALGVIGLAARRRFVK